VGPVNKTLEAHSSIERSEIFLVPKGATTISMKEKLSIEDIHRQFNKFQGYTISEMVYKQINMIL
jgi:copper chaperone